MRSSCASSRTTPPSPAGSPWRGRRSTSRGSPPGSAGWATASGTASGVLVNRMVQVGRAQGPRGLRPRPPGRRVGGLAQSRDRGHAGRKRCHRRLAHPERPAQHGRRRVLDLRPPRRRGGHRVLDPCGHGGGGRRHARHRGAPPAGAHHRPRHGHHAARGRRISRGHRRGEGEGGQDPGAAGPNGRISRLLSTGSQRCLRRSARPRGAFSLVWSRAFMWVETLSCAWLRTLRR